uniref:Tyrosine specific protein phosphatases domain-containing protein n=1 Tax=Mantoniella antarctica TaxID=81844 RepID=A0A7S0X6Z4_9CHLO
MSFAVGAARGAGVLGASNAAASPTHKGGKVFSTAGGHVALNGRGKRSASWSGISRGGARRGVVKVSAADGQDAYNKAMAEYSKTPFEYRHDLGLYYHTILPNLLVGTQPVSTADIDRLHDVEGVTCMFDTQMDKDKEHWGVDAGALKHQMDQRGVEHWRHPFLDFNADSLREGLPHAVAAMDKALRNGHVVYCHCTAGMGRSPGVAIAYLFWCHQFETLDDAYDYLTSRRPCGPKKEAIRGATLDMLAAHGDALPSELVAAGEEGNPRGTTLTVEERWKIVSKLRIAMGDDPEACLQSPTGAVNNR